MREARPMEGRRDTAQQNSHPSDQLEDDGGLELSLGLSCGGSRNKGKGLEGSNVIAAAEVTAEPGVYGEGSSGKPKYVRGSGLEAALKKFLEGRLDEQEESGRLLDAYPQQQGQWELSGSCNKDLEKSICINSQGSTRALGSHDVQAYQEKFGRRDLDSDLDSNRTPALFKEILLPSGVATALGQSRCQGMPLHFIDAMKSGPSAVGLATSSTALLSQFAAVDGDKGETERAVMQKDGLEQLRKFQEARKKRKYLIEEHKQQKKGKKEDERIGLHGFRRPGSNSWVPGLDATAPALDAERAFLALSENEDDEEVQEIRGALQSERDRACVCSDTEQGESTGTAGDDSKGVEMSFISQLRPEEVAKVSEVANRDMNGVHGNARHLKLLQTHAGGNQTLTGRENDIPDDAPESAPALCNLQAGETSSLSPQQAVSASKREKVSGQSSSTGSDFSEDKEEQSCDGDGEASSAPPASIGRDTILASSNEPLLSPGPITSAALPYPPLAPFSVLPMPYSLPVLGPNAPSVPYPVGFTFPYLMQYVPPSPDVQEQNSARPLNNSTLSIPSGHGYPTLQIPPLDSSPPWVQVQRPPTASPLSSLNSAAGHSKISTGLAEDKSKPQGLNLHENGSGQVLTTANDMSAFGSHPLYRATSLNCNQDPIMAFSLSQQLPDPRLLSSLPVPTVPQFGPLRTVSDPVDLDSFKEQGGINAFPGFAASVQVAQALPGALKLPANVIEELGGRQEVRTGKGETAASQLAFRIEDPNAIELNNFSQEEFGRALGGQFHRGSTNILPIQDGLAEELAGLRPGIPPGLKFGGTGSSPDLPWVSTTGPGPNGRPISGVLYRFSTSQVKIVCACHGRHMSPSEFVQHAGGVVVSNPEKNIVVNPFPLSSQPTSA